MRGIYLLLILVAFILLGGCTILQPKDTTNPALLEPQTLVKFSDVPVPSGFKLLPKDSYSFEALGTRVGMLKYQGKASIERVAAFYKEQMGLANWTLLNTIQYGDCQLNFERDAETCIITLTPKGSATIITVALGPKSQVLPVSTTKKRSKPVK